MERAVGAPSTEVMLRSTVKPFGVVALIESLHAGDMRLCAAGSSLKAQRVQLEPAPSSLNLNKIEHFK